MQPRLRADAGDDSLAERIDFVFGDVTIPLVIRWHEQSTAKIGVGSRFELWLLSEGSAGDEKIKKWLHVGKLKRSFSQRLSQQPAERCYTHQLRQPPGVLRFCSD
jgi:hypothetical protein